MDDMPGGVDHFDDTQDDMHDQDSLDQHGLDFASHGGGLGDTGEIGSEIFDSAPHDPADAIPAHDHSDPRHVPDETQHSSRHAETAADSHPSHTPAEHPQPAPHYPRAGSDMQMDINGIHYDAGRIDVDMNGDGHADTAVIHSERDGVAQVEYYTDNDGDGHADELTITDDQGQLISHTEFDEHTDHWDETPLEHQLPTELPDR